MIIARTIRIEKKSHDIFEPVAFLGCVNQQIRAPHISDDNDDDDEYDDDD